MQRPGKNARDRQWMACIREGDRAAFKALFQAYYDDLCDFAEAQVHSPEVAEDLVQELFLDLWHRRDRCYPIGLDEIETNPNVPAP